MEPAEAPRSATALTRAFDWSTTSLGAVESWPLSLRTSVSTMLRSPYPITMFWGPELVTLYNDPFAPIHGAKHPAVLGMPAPTGLAEAWASWARSSTACSRRASRCSSRTLRWSSSAAPEA